MKSELLKASTPVRVPS